MFKDHESQDKCIETLWRKDICFSVKTLVKMLG